MNEPSSSWPTLRRYTGEYLRRVAMPLGGIGTGTVSLGGRGDLRDWELGDRPAKGFAPEATFFALWVRQAGRDPIVRALEGPLDTSEYEGATGSRAANHGLPRFRECAFDAAYPLGQICLSDPDVPVDVRLRAFNPLVPTDADASGIPVAVIRVAVHNRTDEPVDAAVCGSMQNFIGTDGSEGAARGNVNRIRASDRLSGVLMTTRGVSEVKPQWGSLALAVIDGQDVTHRTGWADHSWGNALLDFWDDLRTDGRLDERASTADKPVASLAEARVVGPGQTVEITFLISWHFPNRRAWGVDPATPEYWNHGGPIVGNHYARRYRDAWDVAERTARDLPQLQARTLAFVKAFCASDLPAVVKEAALFNLSTLRSQTCFRTADGRFYGWEGCYDRLGSCMGSCTHVWNYEFATPFLFGELARSMREVEFGHATDGEGLMSFRVHLPLDRAREWGLAAADGQLGCIVKLYREWRLHGDDGFLKELWPKARKALEFCWIPGGWDADRDGVMEGCQHNTMDVEYYGPNPQMGGWYLAALRAAEEMARHLGEPGFAAECRRLYEKGRRWIDENLFNGEYYRHQVRPPASADAVAPGLRHPSMGSQSLDDPDLQIGDGCLIDQLVGQYAAHLVGLGYVLDTEHVRAALSSVLRYNRKSGFYDHFNHMRSFVLGDESALLMCSYPRGNRPVRPFPYFTEVMTGFEYTAAVGLIQEGMVEEGLEVIAAIRERYDGRRRNPFDEAECGHHYARAMASWSAVLALTGFRYDAVLGHMRFRGGDGPASYFWSTGDAWGTCALVPERAEVTIRLLVVEGTVRLSSIGVGPERLARLPQPTTLRAGEKLELCGRSGA